MKNSFDSRIVEFETILVLYEESHGFFLHETNLSARGRARTRNMIMLSRFKALIYFSIKFTFFLDMSFHEQRELVHAVSFKPKRTAASTLYARAAA